MNSRRETCLRYLQAYAAKDLATIEALFAPEVALRDWKIRVCGRAAALAETRRNFESVEHLAIEVLHLHESSQAVAAELRILINGTQELFVVDVIGFDAQGRIDAIRAYLGRGDAEA